MPLVRPESDWADESTPPTLADLTPAPGALGPLTNLDVAPSGGGDVYQRYFDSNPAFLEEWNRVRALGDTRSQSAWMKEAIQASPQDQIKFNAMRYGTGIGGGIADLVSQVGDLLSGVDQADPGESPMPEPPANVLPQPIQDLIDALIPPAPSTGAGSTLPTPSALADTSPGLVVAPTLNQTNNTFLQNITNFFFGAPAAETGASSPVGTNAPVVMTGDNSSVLASIKNFFVPPATFTPTSNGSPVYNAAAQGSVTNPQTFAAGQVIDRNQSAPQSASAAVAGFIRGLNLPGFSQIKNDRALILATLAAPFLAVLVLWILGKLFRRA